MNTQFNGTIVEENGIRSISGGGTNASTATGALANLGAYPASNPNGYITGINTSNFYTNDNPSGFITGIENLVYTTGDQIISGKKTFTQGFNVGLEVGDSSTLYVSSGKVGINNENPVGALDVSGSTLFSQRPTVNGTGVLLSGDINTSNFYTKNNSSGYITGISNLVYTTGDQVISGLKTFSQGISIEGDSSLSALFVSGQRIGINNENPQASLDVSGSAFFSERPFVNSVAFMLSGDINTGNFYPNSNPSGFITGIDTSNFYTNDNPSGFITGGKLPVANGGTGRTIGNYSIYGLEIHVGKDGNDTTGDGTLINPVLTITKALTLVAAGRNTIIVHPGEYAESPTVTSTNTTIATSELTGANTLLSGTLTLSAAARISGLKMTNLTITGSGNIYISNCTVDTRVIKSGTNYVEIINSELQCTAGIQITGAGIVSILGNKCWGVVVSNAAASVLIKDCFQVRAPSVTAGSLQFDGCAIFAAPSTTIAVTSSAGTNITLANSFVLNSVGSSVERVSLGGNYSILNLVYDKANSTFTGTNLNAVDYFSVINAEKIGVNTVADATVGLKLDSTGVKFNDGTIQTTAAIVRVSIPATSTSTGATGQIAVDNANNFLYVCTNTNVWKRVLLTTF
jgi:hypothetical protein